jgi:hypothetical protein
MTEPALRRLRMASAALFAVSTAFPIVASLMPIEEAPRWLGVADVVIAFALVATGIYLVSRHQEPAGGRIAETAVAVLRAAASVFLVLLVLFFLVGDDVKWQVLLPGLAWRAWLFALALPAWLALSAR